MSHPSISNNNSGYDYFVRTYYGTETATGNPISKTSNTNVGHQLDSANGLHKTALRLADGESILQENLRVMMDPDSKKTHKKVASSKLKKLGPLMTVAATISSCAANIVSPIAGTKVSHKRLEKVKERGDP